MIKAIHFKNYKALRDTTLPLGRLTLLIGPNGSGKSTALAGLTPWNCRFEPGVLSAHTGNELQATAEIRTEFGGLLDGVSHRDIFELPGKHHRNWEPRGSRLVEGAAAWFERIRVYALNADSLARHVKLQPRMEIGHAGDGFAGVLDRLRDGHPERWEALNVEFSRWLPEFDRILFETPSEGMRAVMLRLRGSQHAIEAQDVSQGALLALAILTLAYLPDPPPVVGLEEPGRGIHPRLLRDIRDAMYRLAYPETFGEKRDPVQVVATTHSPYMVDLFRDHPEEIVIASKEEDNVRFTRLSELPNVEEILDGASLGDIWYSGVLGGVPAER